MKTLINKDLLGNKLFFTMSSLLKKMMKNEKCSVLLPEILKRNQFV